MEWTSETIRTGWMGGTDGKDRCRGQMGRTEAEDRWEGQRQRADGMKISGSDRMRRTDEWGEKVGWMNGPMGWDGMG